MCNCQVTRACNQGLFLLGSKGSYGAAKDHTQVTYVQNKCLTLSIIVPESDSYILGNCSKHGNFAFLSDSTFFIHSQNLYNYPFGYI